MLALPVGFHLAPLVTQGGHDGVRNALLQKLHPFLRAADVLLLPERSQADAHALLHVGCRSLLAFQL
jgi:hypothetical protein